MQLYQDIPRIYTALAADDAVCFAFHADFKHFMPNFAWERNLWYSKARKMTAGEIACA